MKDAEMNGFEAFSADPGSNLNCATASIKQEPIETTPGKSAAVGKDETADSNIPELRRGILLEQENQHSSTSKTQQPSPDQGTDEIQALENEIINSQVLLEDQDKPSTKLTIFEELYSCSDCGEVFYTQFGLESHHKRITMNASFNCTHCELKRIFPNRCRILNHLKSHGVIPSSDSMKNRISFGPLDTPNVAYDYSIAIPRRFTSTQTSPASTTDPCASQYHENTHSESYLPSTIPEPNGHCAAQINPSQMSNGEVLPCVVAGKPDTPTLQSKGSNQWDYFCTGCQTDYQDLPNFVTHIRTAENPPSSTDLFQCVIDNVPCRSLCGLTLHTSVFHKQLPPFICPDCGQSFEDYDDIIDHARNDCLHFLKAIMFKCNNRIKKNSVTEEVKERPPDCLHLFHNTHTLFQHLEIQHTRNVLQCSRCPNAFTTKDLLQKHIYSEHGISCEDRTSATQLLIEQMSKQLTQCLLCEVVFCTIPAYRNHFMSKLTEHCQRLVAFVCEACSEAFEDRETCRSHNCKELETPNRMSFTDEQTSAFTDLISDEVPPAKRAKLTNQLKSYNRHKCTHCARFVSSKNLDKHEEFCRHNPRLTLFCKVCSKSFRGNFGFLNHGKYHLNAGLRICLLCNNQTLSETEELGTHILLNHVNTIETYPYPCTLCDTTLSDSLGAEVHFKGHHSTGTDNRFKCAICGLQFAQLKDLTTHKALDHADQSLNTLFTLPAEMKTDTVEDVQSWNYRCKFCKFKKFVTVQGLRKHVRCHHVDVDYKKVRWNDMKRGVANTTLITNSSPSKSASIPRILGKVAKSDTTTCSKQDTRVASATKCTEINEAKCAIEPSSRGLDGTFHCLKCDQSSFSSEDAFYDHVRTEHIWKEDDEEEDEDGNAIPISVGDNYWCPECSLEFVAKPSFEKHILFAHVYIENVKQYLDKIGYGQREKPVLENQCEVCRLKCGGSLEYESHIRSHGMAFLKLRQQRKSN